MTARSFSSFTNLLRSSIRILLILSLPSWVFTKSPLVWRTAFFRGGGGVGGGGGEWSSTTSNDTTLVATSSSSSSSSSSTAEVVVAASKELLKESYSDVNQRVINNDENVPNPPKNNTILPEESIMQRMPIWKQRLPPLLQRKGPKTLQKINLGGGAAEIYLLGTAHVSNDSSSDVKLLLEAVDPDCIFVELCEARLALLEGGVEDDALPQMEISGNDTNSTLLPAAPTTQPNFWDRLDHIRQSQGGSRLQAFSTLLLTSVQEDYAETLGVELGGEFRAAHRYWMSRITTNQNTPTDTPASFFSSSSPPPTQNRPSLILGDRPLSLTLVRAWESLWWWPKIKVIAGLLWSSWIKPNPEEIRKWLESILREESDILTESLQELRRHFPSLHDTIIAERDAWLACKLVQTCRIQIRNAATPSTQPPSPPQKIVAIVGAGHVPGIIQWLTGNVTAKATSSARSSSSATATPEQILLNLTFTKRWAHDEIVQRQMIPMWTKEVTQVYHYAPDTNNNKNNNMVDGNRAGWF